MVGIILFYVTFLLIAFFASCIKSKKERLHFQIILCFLMMFIFFSFRDTVVINDTSHYYAHLYEYLQSPTKLQQSIFKFDPHERFEYLYVVLERFVGKYIWSDPYSIIFISSTITTIFYLWIIKRYTPLVAIACFFAFSNIVASHCVIRNTYALILFMIAIEYLKQNKTLKYYCLIALAFLFHSSAIILVIIPIFKNLKPSRKNIILTFFAICIISIFIFPLLLIFGIGDSSYFAEFIGKKTLPIAAILNTLFIAFYLLIVYYVKRKYNIIYPNNLILWLSILNLYTNIVAIPFLVFSRFSAYFSMYTIFVLMYSLFHKSSCKPLKKALSRNSITAIIITILLVRFSLINIYKNEWANLYPYSFYDFQGGYRKQVHTTPNN